MILAWLIIIPLVGGAVAWALERRGEAWPRRIAFGALALDAAMVAGVWAAVLVGSPVAPGDWMLNLDLPWIPALGIRFRLSMDGLNLPLVALTIFLGVMAVGISRHEPTRRVGFFHFNLLWILAGILGVFLALDLFLFYFFWELMLVPMVLLIGIWGHERRIYAAVKFFLFTQASGLLMLVAILGLYFIHGRAAGGVVVCL